MPFYSEIPDPVLIPVPAATRERHQQRFATFCSQLARRLKITDGFRAVWIESDRPQLKGASKDENRIGHAVFNKSYIAGRHVYLIDDILTSGATFVQTKRELEKMGAASVTGLFLGKTV